MSRAARGTQTWIPDGDQGARAQAGKPKALASAREDRCPWSTQSALQDVEAEPGGNGVGIGGNRVGTVG